MSDPYDAIPDGTAVPIPKGLLNNPRPNCCHLALAISVAMALLFVAIIVLPCGPHSGELPAPGPAAPESTVGPAPAFPKVIKSTFDPTIKDEPKKLSVAVEQEGGQQTPEGYTAEVGELLRFSAVGNAVEWNWDSPEIDSKRASTAEDDRVCFFSGRTPGTFFFTLAGRDEDELLQTRHVVIVGQRPAPPPGPGPVPTPVPPGPVVPSKVTQVTYVYEKTQHYIPREVSAALSKLNTEQKILASPIEQDAKNGLNNVPAQYRIAVTTAQAHGLPCLIVQAGDAVVKVVKDPKTEAQVLEAVK